MSAGHTCEHQQPADPPPRQMHIRLWLFLTQEVASFGCQTPLLGKHSSLQTTQQSTVLRRARQEGARGGTDSVLHTHPYRKHYGK